MVRHLCPRFFACIRQIRVKGDIELTMGLKLHYCIEIGKRFMVSSQIFISRTPVITCQLQFIVPSYYFIISLDGFLKFLLLTKLISLIKQLFIRLFTRDKKKKKNSNS